MLVSSVACLSRVDVQHRWSEGGEGAVACLSKHRREHGWTYPRFHGNAVFCFFEQSDAGSLAIVETQKSSHWNEKSTSLSVTLVSLTQPGVHISLAMS